LFTYPAVTVSTDGTLIGAASLEHVRVCDLATEKPIATVVQKRTFIRSVEFSSDKSLITVESNDEVDRRIDVVEVATGNIKRYSAPEAHRCGFTSARMMA
jgi:hypothetical protein